MVSNPNFYGQSTHGTPNQIEDGVDFPHTGIIKALSDGLGQNYAISGFDITIDSATQIDVGAGVIFRDGERLPVGAVPNLTLSSSYTNGYHLLVANNHATAPVLEIRSPSGVTAAANKVPEYNTGDTIIAVITHNGTANVGIQYLTVNKTQNSLSVGHNDGGYTESLSISSSAGDTTIENKVPDKNIILKVNDGGVSTEVMRIDGATANVGIGTDSPMNKLQVSHTGADGNNGILIVRDDDPTVENEILGGIGFDSTDGNVPSSVLEASVYIAAFAAESHGVGDKGGDLTFGTAAIDDNDDTASTEHMRITDNGNVGIGTDSPTTKLHVKTTGADDAVIIESTEAGATDAPDLVLYRNSTSPAVSDEIGSIRFRGKDSSAGDKDYNRITSVIRDNTAASADADLIFQSLSNSVEIEMMKISRIDGIVINEIGASYIDTRIEGDTDANLFFTDASVDRVGIGTNTPTQKLTVGGSIKSTSYHGSVVEITGSGLPVGTPPATVSLLNLDSDTHRTIIADTQASAPNPPNALTLNLPAASGTHQGWEMKIICKNNAGGLDDLVITPAGSDELISATGAVIGNNSSPLSLTTGKIYTVIHITPTQYMAIQLN